MAITLDELLGRNTQTAQNAVDSFPSYEEFRSTRAATQNRVEQTNTRYNFDVAPVQSLRSAESVREYEQNRPYVAPQSNEYQTRDYAFYDNLRQQAPVRPQQTQQTVTPVQQPVREYDNGAYVVSRPQNLYEFTAQDTDRLSDEELYNRLAHTDVSYGRQESVSEQNMFARKAQRTQSRQQEKTHGRLNAKGKAILGVYIAVIALVISLIVVNATKINKGEAVTPTSAINDKVAVQNANILESLQIDSNYEVRV